MPQKAPAVHDDPVRPMLATPGSLPTSEAVGWAFEVKWDGMRALATASRGRVRLSSRAEMDVTARFREIAESPSLAANLADGTVLDGEIVAFDPDGRPSFSLLAPRIQGHRVNAVRVTYIVFDILRWQGQDVIAQSYAERRALLHDVLEPGPFVAVPDSFDDGPALMDTTAAQGLEGVVAKRVGSPYRPGVRSPDWVKVPHRLTRSYVIGGWKHGTSSGRPLASLLVGTPTADSLLVFDGAVGSGLADRDLQALLPVLREITREERPFHWATTLPDEQGVTWTEPILVVDVEHLGRTSNRLLRAPSVIRVRPDQTYDSVWQAGES
jgi:bifunctional non-homologous end joining protein LigD